MVIGDFTTERNCAQQEFHHIYTYTMAAPFSEDLSWRVAWLNPLVNFRLKMSHFTSLFYLTNRHLLHRPFLK